MLKPEATDRLTIDEVIANDRVQPSVNKLLAMPEYKKEYINSEKCSRQGEAGQALTEDEAWFDQDYDNYAKPLLK